MANSEIATIGYEGITPDILIATLKEHSIACLIDVRRNAISRKKGFSKTALSSLLAASGIAYRHLPQAGIASAERRALVSEEHRRELLDGYRKRIADEAELLDILASLAGQRRCVLMCFEADHKRCHRKPLSDVLAETACLDVLHIEPAKSRHGI